MSKVVKVVKTLRNHWKKSLFATVVLSYGVKYAKDSYECNLLMAKYCREASKYGQRTLPEGQRPRNITVFLNPAANKRKAKKDFDKYCGPLLYLAGVSVNVVQTKSEGQARFLAENVDESVDAVVIAGGDGTVSEAVTGLLRRADGDNPLSKSIPLGLLPLGRTNTVANSLFSNRNSDRVMIMAEATMAIIRECIKSLDVLRIEQLEKENEDQRPVYSLTGIHWGAFYDAYAKRDKYWYWGILRPYVSYIFMGLKGEATGMTWNCTANINYSLPCSGCSHCQANIAVRKKATQSQPRWWQVFVPKQKLLGATETFPMTDFSRIRNEACREIHELDVSAIDFSLRTANCNKNCVQEGVPHIEVSIGPSSVNYSSFVRKGWDYIANMSLNRTYKLLVKDIKLKPMDSGKPDDAEKLFYIDNDNFEVRPIYVKLLPKKIFVFCRHENII